ncbi:MAG: ABC transporter permease, partial [Gammaproteobacteria bacterium]
MSESVVIVGAKRTPIGSFQGQFSSMTAAQLGSVAIKAAMEQAGVEGADIEDAHLGCVLPAGQGQAPSNGLEIIVHRRYNPEGITQYNIVPGLLGVILQLTMVMMTAMALTREVERGTMENLLSMPANPLEIMLGKVVPYLIVGAVQVVVVLVSAKLVFNVPFVGSLSLVLAGVFVFVLALVILGYLLSTVSRTQMQAMQLTFFFFLPSLLLSGFMFPYRGMPAWAQVIGEIFPL